MKVHPPGTRLGQFEVISYPVTNDVSIDYTCLDHERSCPALLKTLRPELLSSRTARDCFAQSGAAWAGYCPFLFFSRNYRTKMTYCK